MDNANNAAEQLAFQAATGAPSPQQYAVNKAVERAALRARFSGREPIKPTVYVRATEREVVEAPDKDAWARERGRCVACWSERCPLSASPVSPVWARCPAEPEPLPQPAWYVGERYRAWVHETARDLFADARSVTASDEHALELAREAAVACTQDERELQDVLAALSGVVEAREGAD